MTEGKVEVFLSYKEPEYRDNLLWLRPYLDKEGYELLYYGSYGWTPLITCCGDTKSVKPIVKPDIEDNSNIGNNNTEFETCPSIEDIFGVNEEVKDGVDEDPPIIMNRAVFTPCNCRNRK